MNIPSLFLFILFELKYVSLKMATVNQNKCGSKLLDDTVAVPDSSFSASSSFEHKNKMDKKMDLSPKAARESYDKDNQEFAWCPKNKVSSDLKDYLEIDMGRLVVINFAQTRGRFAQGAGKEYIPFYKLKYRREAAEEWRLYKKFDPLMGFNDILKGPSDPFLDAYETLDPPIVTRWIRIYPYSYETMRVCMKLQLFGCKFENNVLEYRIPQGNEPKSTFISFPKKIPNVKVFRDSSYDGSYDRGLLNGGLGKLTDNISGGNIISSPSDAQHFVGWNSKDMPATADKTITLWFRFDSIRNFSYVKLNGFENSTLRIAHPSTLEAKFSIHGEIFNDADTIISSLPETKAEMSSSAESSWTQFNLHNRVGQYLQLKLFFQSDWILLSEIDFMSDKVVGFATDRDIVTTTTQGTVTEASSIPENPQSHIDSDASVDAVYILTILLCLLVGIIVAISVFWLLIRRKRIKRKKDMKKHELAFYSQNPFKTLGVSPHNQVPVHHMSNSYLGKYNPGSQRPSICSQADPCLYKHNISPHNCSTIPKQAFQANEGSIYTSIPGSDNDSSLSTDYMASNGVTSSHPYSQTVPVTGTMTDYILNQPQIIRNPLAEFIDNQQFYCRGSPNGIRSYEPDLLGLGNSPRHSNHQSFSGSIGYQPFEYSSATMEKSYYPIPNSYQGSPNKKELLLK